MKKIGILTFHYSNNYGGVLQALSLFSIVKALGYETEVINYVPSNYKPYSIIANLGLRKNILKNKTNDLNLFTIWKKINIMNNHCDLIIKKFDIYRENNMVLSKRVDENSLETILSDYSAIIVGSDQIWNPSQRKSPIYFLNYGDKYKGKKISYAPDSTTKDVKNEDINILRNALAEFNDISVRNEHTYEFVKTVTKKDTTVVADPTLLFDFQMNREKLSEEYILTYILGEEIEGSHKKVIEKIRNKYGNIPVYSIKIPTMKFELSPFADKVFYDLDPDEWINMFKNATFVYTDSFHGVLFSLKFHKPFLAYYTEELRSTRFIDLGKRYGIARYIVQKTSEIDDKKLLESLPDFSLIDNIIKQQKSISLEFLKNALLD